MNETLRTKEHWKAIVASVVGIAYGASVWAMSPIITGRQEPWDATPYYWIAMPVGGFICAFASIRYFWVPVIGIYIGQLAYAHTFLNPVGVPIMPLFISIAIFGIPLTLIGASLSKGVTIAVQRSKRNRSN
jgi:hypothetical protein